MVQSNSEGLIPARLIKAIKCAAVVNTGSYGYFAALPVSSRGTIIALIRVVTDLKGIGS